MTRDANWVSASCPAGMFTCELLDVEHDPRGAPPLEAARATRGPPNWSKVRAGRCRGRPTGRLRGREAPARDAPSARAPRVPRRTATRGPRSADSGVAAHPHARPGAMPSRSRAARWPWWPWPPRTPRAGHARRPSRGTSPRRRVGAGLPGSVAPGGHGDPRCSRSTTMLAARDGDRLRQRGDGSALGDLGRLFRARRCVSSSTTNSSPPKRATVSGAQTTPRSRTATWRSSSSPALWPRLSLTTLNRSRSSSSKAMWSRRRARAASACVSRSANRARLGSPVSTSWSARRSLSRACRAAR